MDSFSSYGDELSRRYDRAVEAANSQRQRERQSTESYATSVYNDMSMEEGSPAPPEAPTEGVDEQFDPGVDDRAGAMKNYLIQKSKDRMDRVVAPED